MTNDSEPPYVSIYMTRRQAEALAAAALWSMDKSLATKPRAADLRAALKTLARDGVRGAA